MDEDERDMFAKLGWEAEIVSLEVSKHPYSFYSVTGTWIEWCKAIL